MGMRSKRRVKQRSTAHVKVTKATHKKKKRAKSRGLHPASKKRRVRAARRKRK
jgi:hypothetical protein